MNPKVLRNISGLSKLLKTFKAIQDFQVLLFFMNYSVLGGWSISKFVRILILHEYGGEKALIHVNLNQCLRPQLKKFYQNKTEKLIDDYRDYFLYNII